MSRPEPFLQGQILLWKTLQSFYCSYEQTLITFIALILVLFPEQFMAVFLLGAQIVLFYHNICT